MDEKADGDGSCSSMRSVGKTAANAVKPDLECKIYRSTPLYEGMFAPAAILQKHDTVAKSVINVPDSFDVKQVLVGVNVTYTRLGALRVRLEAQPGPDASDEDKRGTNLAFRKGKAKSQMIDTYFSDTAEEPFPNTPPGTPLPDDAEPFTGVWKPERILGQLSAGSGTVAGRGGSEGLWTLMIEDRADEPETRHGRIGSWELKLCHEPSEEEVPPTIDEAPEDTDSSAIVPPDVAGPILDQLQSILADDPNLAEELDQELEEEQENQAGAFGTALSSDRPTIMRPFSRMRAAIDEFRESHGVKRLPFQVKLAMWEFAVVKKFVWLVYLYKAGKLTSLPSLKDFDFKTQLPGLYDYLDDLTADFNGLNFRLFSEAEAPSPEEGMDLDEVMFR